MNLSKSQPALSNHRLKTKEYIGYALGDTASNFFFQMFGIFLVYYYVDVWGIDAKKVALMMLIVRIFDAVNDPIMGLISDRTNTRWGKFRPYILFAAIPYGICGYMMFAGPDLSENGKLIYAYITYALMLVIYTVINVPYSSLMGVLSPSSNTRTVASSYRFVGAFSGGFLISLFVRPLVKYLGGDNEVLGFQLTLAIFAVVSVLMFWTTFFTTKERVKPPKGQKTNVKEELGELFQNFPWVMLLLAAVLSTSFIALRSGSTVFYFKYLVGGPTEMEFTMEPGEHTLEVAYREDGLYFDGLLITDDLAVDAGTLSDDAISDELWREAESADVLTAPMETYSDDPNASGAYIGVALDVNSVALGVVEDVNSSPPAPIGTASYNFDVPTAGTYKVIFKLKVPTDSYYDDSCWVRIKGATYNTGSDWIKFNGIADHTPSGPDSGWVWVTAYNSDEMPLFSIGSLDFDKTSIFLSIGMLAQIAGTIMLGFIARKIDKKYAAAILCTITGLCFMTFYFLPKEQFALLVVVNAIGYLCMGPTSALTWALYGDVADYGEWKFGRRSTGLVFSASLFAIKTGVTVGGFLLPWFLAYYNYVKPPEGDYIAQSDNAKLGILLAFSLVPGIIALLKAGSLLVYPLSQKRVHEIEQELETRRAAEANE